MSKKNKKEKKARKEQKKIRASIKEALNANKTKGKTNPMVESLIKSVLLNKAVIKNDKEGVKVWQDDYYYKELFSDFKKLVTKHNELYSVKMDDLIMKINLKKHELQSLKEKIKNVKDEKNSKKIKHI